MRTASLDFSLIFPQFPLRTSGAAHSVPRLGPLLMALAVLALCLSSAVAALAPAPAAETLELPATPAGQILAEPQEARPEDVKVDSENSATAASEIGGAELSDWKTLAELLEKARSTLDLPALAAAWVVDGEIVEQAAVGVRSVAGKEPVTIDDLFHLGSVTKSMTATMIGHLVEDGVMAWDDTIGEILADLDPDPDYRTVTVRELLGHRGRIPPYTHLDAAALVRFNSLPGSTTEQRTVFVAEVLREEPLVPGFEYSNAGYTVAALMAERRTGKSWEILLRDKVFAALDLSSAGLGWPATAERPDQPRGHYRAGRIFLSPGLGQYVLGAFLAPAGNVHCAIADLARYAAAHLAGLRGRDGALKAATIRRLHTPANYGEQSYAGGWMIDTAADGAEQHWHNGSAGTFFALVTLFPRENTAFVLLANAGLDPVGPLADKILAAYRARWKESRGAAESGNSN